jgi:hypothetical protein
MINQQDPLTKDEGMHTSGSSPAVLSPVEQEQVTRKLPDTELEKEQQRTPEKMRVEDLNFYYGRTRALKSISLSVAAESGDRVHRPIGMRQINIDSHAEQDERRDTPHASRGSDRTGW